MTVFLVAKQAKTNYKLYQDVSGIIDFVEHGEIE